MLKVGTLAVLVLLVGLAQPAKANDYFYLQHGEKVANFGVSYGITDQLMRSGYAWDPYKAALATLTLALVKELAEGGLAQDDFYADMGSHALGSVSAAFIRIRF